MKDADKAPVVPETLGQEAYNKFDRRDKIVTGFVIAVVVSVAILVLLGIFKIQQVIDQNQASTLERSVQATSERQKQQDYIKCIVLIRFDMTPEQLTTRDGVERALDSCAAGDPVH